MTITACHGAATSDGEAKSNGDAKGDAGAKRIIVAAASAALEGVRSSVDDSYNVVESAHVCVTLPEVVLASLCGQDECEPDAALQIAADHHGATSSIMGVHPNPKIHTDSEACEVPRANIHDTHHKMLLNTIVFCKRCGYHSSKKTQKLAKECPLKPMHNDVKRKLNRMLNRKRPDRGVLMWPDGQSTQVAIAPINLDGS